MLQHWAHSRNMPTATDEKKKRSTRETALCPGSPGQRAVKRVCVCVCVFSVWYNFGKIIKIVATRCHILKLKCTKFDFGGVFAQDPAGGAYSAPPDPLAGFKGAYFYFRMKYWSRWIRSPTLGP